MEFKQNLPKIDPADYPVRWKAINDYMEQSELDAVILYGDDRATYGSAHIRYLAGIPVHFEPMLLLFTRGCSEPVILCGPESDGYCALYGNVKDIRVLREMTHPDEVYLYSNIVSLRDVVTELSHGAAIKRIGIAPKAYMGAEIFESITQVFADCEIVDIEYGISMLRAVKSPSEIAVIRYAYEIAVSAFKKGLEFLKPGVYERDIAAEIEYQARKMGSEGTGIDTMVCSGIYASTILGRTTQKKIENNEIVNFTIAPRYEGYHGAIARTMLIGTPDEKAVAQITAEAKAQKECSAMMKAGVLGADIEAHARKIMSDAGFETGFAYSGIHSVGVIEFEAPIFGPGCKEYLKDNMIISLDVPNYNASSIGSRTECGYAVHKDGVDCLTNDELIIRI